MGPLDVFCQESSCHTFSINACMSGRAGRKRLRRTQHLTFQLVCLWANQKQQTQFHLHIFFRGKRNWGQLKIFILTQIGLSHAIVPESCHLILNFLIAHSEMCTPISSSANTHWHPWTWGSGSISGGQCLQWETQLLVTCSDRSNTGIPVKSESQINEECLVSISRPQILHGAYLYYNNIHCLSTTLILLGSLCFYVLNMATLLVMYYSSILMTSRLFLSHLPLKILPSANNLAKIWCLEVNITSGVLLSGCLTSRCIMGPFMKDHTRLRTENQTNGAELDMILHHLKTTWAWEVVLAPLFNSCSRNKELCITLKGQRGTK